MIMTAQEMFKKLGYEKIECNSLINWCKVNVPNDMITFYLEDKDFSCEYYRHANVIDMPLLKAINQQCKDLGWLDETVL